MSITLVEGTIGEVLTKLENIKLVIDEKQASGYPLFHSAENWVYRTARDGRVCFICNPFDGDTFSGDEVRGTFPNAVYLGDNVAHPRTHDNPGFPDAGRFGSGRKGIFRRKDDEFGCGCRLHLMNSAEAFEEQLHRDKEATM